MTPSAEPDWQEIERLARTTDLPLSAIARMTGASSSSVYARAARGRWRAGSKPRATTEAGRRAERVARTRRALIQRFYQAIDTKLKQMERRMQTDMKKRRSAQSAADHERDTRAIGGLMNQLAKISEYETDLEQPTGPGDDFAAIAAEAERYRRELAERLARLVPPLE